MVYTHGSLLYLLSAQGSNVDGDTVREFCTQLRVEKIVTVPQPRERFRPTKHPVTSGDISFCVVD